MSYWMSKRCAVCGDDALCFNRSGLSCNPCRIFFNRNITRLSALICPKSAENCQIDFVTRKCCAKCRMNKCLAIGMCKRVPISRHRAAQQASQLNYSQSKANIDFQQNILFCTFKNISVPAILDNNELEHIQTIQRSIEFWFEDERQLGVIGTAPNPRAILNLPALYIRRIVKFCKSVPGYRSLNSGDQLVILRKFFFEFTIVRRMFMYDFERHCYYSIANESGNQAVLVTKDNLKCMKNIDCLEEALQYGHAFHLEMDNDVVVRDLESQAQFNLLINQATVLYLFQSRPNYSNPEFIRYQYFVYSRLLHRYFEHKFGCTEKASQKFAALLDSMATIGRVRDIFRMLLYEVGPDNLDQVIVEAFDLTNNFIG